MEGSCLGSIRRRSFRLALSGCRRRYVERSIDSVSKPVAHHDFDRQCDNFLTICVVSFLRNVFSCWHSTVKSRMQGLEASKYRNTIHCIQELIKNEGILAFYKGVGPRLTRVCLEVGITMSLYGEIVKMVSDTCTAHKRRTALEKRKCERTEKHLNNSPIDRNVQLISWRHYSLTGSGRPIPEKIVAVRKDAGNLRIDESQGSSAGMKTLESKQHNK